MESFKSASFDDHTRDLLDTWHVPGLAIVLVEDNEISSKAFGYASLEPPVACKTNTIFDIASCSKSFTAASVGLLVEDNKNHPDIEWNTPVSKILPDDFVLESDDYTKNVTIEDILSHRSGLGNHDASYMGISAEVPDTAASVTRNLRNLPITAPIRSKFQYCNMLFTVATHLIETRTGMAFSDFLQKIIFGPLKMQSSYIFPSAVKAAGLSSRLTQPYLWQEDSKSYKTLTWYDETAAQGAGSICTSVDDLGHYLHALLHKTPPFSGDLIESLTTPRIIEDPEEDPNRDPLASWYTYALGWEVYYYRGQRIVKHDGLIAGFSGVTWFLSELKLGGAILGNAEDAGEVGEMLMKELIDAKLNIPETERVDWNARLLKRRQEAKAKKAEDPASFQKTLMRDGQTEPEALLRALDKYTGVYHNNGYHSLNVTIKDDRLFVLAEDRSMPITLSFKHIHSQNVFVCRLTSFEDEGEWDEFRAEFEFEDVKENARASRMGLWIEPEYEGAIWFDRVTNS